MPLGVVSVLWAQAGGVALAAAPLVATPSSTPPTSTTEGPVLAPPTSDEPGPAVSPAPNPPAAARKLPPPQQASLAVPAAPAQASAASPAAPEKRDRVGTSLKGALGGYYELLYAVPMYGGAISLSVGPFRGRRFTYLALSLEHGRTEQGLSVWGAHVGFSPEWALGALRLGFGVGGGFLSLSRITGQDPLARLSLLCVALHASVDIVTTAENSGAFFIDATLRADLYNAPVVWGPTVSLGYRADWGSKP